MLTRRRLLQTTAGLLATARPGRPAGASGTPDPPAPAATFPERTLWLHRVQTREEGRALYFQDHALVPDGYALLCYLLRDVRADRMTRVDVKLIHLLFGMQAWMRAVGIRQPLRVHSGRLSDARNPRRHRGRGGPFHAPHRPGGGFHRGRDSERGAGEARRAVSRRRGGRVSDVRPRRYRAGESLGGLMGTSAGCGGRAPRALTEPP